MKISNRALQLVAGLLLTGSFTMAWADHFKKLSIHHTSYGVSQFNYGVLSRSDRDSRFVNPVHVTQVAATFVYTRSNRFTPDNPEVYLGCSIEVLTPHAALGGDRFDTPFVPAYYESIWVPLEPVRIHDDENDSDSDSDGDNGLTRVADGLGGRNLFNRNQGGALAHPSLFSLPSDDVVPGQRQAAIDCVLAGLSDLGLSLDLFEDFGVE